MFNLVNDDLSPTKRYYRSQFQQLTRPKSILFYSELIQWPLLQEWIATKHITLSQVEELWTYLPKKAYVTRHFREEGIVLETFYALIDAIQDKMCLAKRKL